MVKEEKLRAKVDIIASVHTAENTVKTSSKNLIRNDLSCAIHNKTKKKLRRLPRAISTK
jgi:hypothetical protein